MAYGHNGGDIMTPSGNRLLDELLKMNEQLTEVKAKLEKIEQNTKIGMVA